MARLDSAHFNMVEQQLRPNEVLSSHVLNAINNLDRADFCEDSFAELAYADTQLPIGYGQNMLSPLLEGRFLQSLQLTKQDNVLEIGTGSGYFTALIAHLADHVTSVEIIPELSEQADLRLQKLGLHNISLQIGDAAKGWLLPHNVDVIVLTAAVTQVPDAYLQQLSVGGRLLAVTGYAPAMSVQLITRADEQRWETQSLFETVIPYMLNAQPTTQFEF